MIRLIKSSSLDNYNLSQIPKPVEEGMEEFDFSKVVVNKPWGHEYVMYQKPEVSIWVLHLKKGCMTSMHCHENKKTALLVLSGKAICSTLNEEIGLGEGDGLILDKKVFHSTKAISEEGITLIEVETPNKKTDLIRLKDAYGREKKGYENKNYVSSDLNDFERVLFGADEINLAKKLGSFDIILEKFDGLESVRESLKEDNGYLGIILEGRIIDKLTGDSFGVADMFEFKDIKNANHYFCEEPLVLLKFLRK